MGDFDLPPLTTRHGDQLVTSAGIEIPSAAGGLREAMKIEPRVMDPGDRVYVLLECDVAKVRHDPIDAKELTGPMRRVHVLQALAGTIMDPEVAKPAIDAQKERITLAREAEQGIMRIDLDGTPDGGKPAPKPKGGKAKGGLQSVPAGTDSDGFIDADAVRAVLRNLSKDDLRALCDANGIDYAKSAAGARLIQLLVDGVPDLAEKVAAVAAAADGSTDANA